LPVLRQKLEAYTAQLRDGLDETSSVMRLSALVPEFKRPQAAMRAAG